MESFEMYYERTKKQEENKEKMKYATPKYKIGDKIEAHWAGGSTTIHVITGVEKALHGFWYTWENSDGSGNGLYEIFISKISE